MNFKRSHIILMGAVFIVALLSCSPKSKIYRSPIGLSAYSYQFKSNNKFSYSFVNCIGSKSGFGEYEIIEDTVRFKFDSVVLSKIEVNRIDLRKDSIAIDLFVNELSQNKPLPYCTAAVYREGLLQSGFETDQNGYARITMVSDGTAYEIQILYVGMENYRFITSSHGSYEIKVDLSSGYGNSLGGEIREYKLLELSDSLFRFSRFDDSLSVTKLYLQSEE